MIKEYMNEALEPVVELGLKRGDVITTISAVVDTGFSGYLCLAERRVDELDMTFEFAEPDELANGEVVVKDVFQGSIVFDGCEQGVDLILTASEDTLIGASLLKDYKLTVDYPKRTVRIERMVDEPV